MRSREFAFDRRPVGFDRDRGGRACRGNRLAGGANRHFAAGAACPYDDANAELQRRRSELPLRAALPAFNNNIDKVVTDGGKVKGKGKGSRIHRLDDGPGPRPGRWPPGRRPPKKPPSLGPIIGTGVAIGTGVVTVIDPAGAGPAGAGPTGPSPAGAGTPPPGGTMRNAFIFRLQARNASSKTN